MTGFVADGQLPRVASATAHSRVTAVDAALPTLEEVYRQHAGFVWRAIRRFSVPEDEAEDVLHNVFLVVDRKLPSYDGRAALRSWLWGITRGVVANHHRARKRERQRLQRLQPAPVTAVDETVARKQVADQVEAFIATLPLQMREIFELCDVEGMRGPDVAQTLGLELAVVYARLRTARRRMQRYFEAPPGAENQRGARE